MIKSHRGETQLVGILPELLADLAVISEAMLKAIIDEEKSDRETAIEFIESAVSHGLDKNKADKEPGEEVEADETCSVN